LARDAGHRRVEFREPEPPRVRSPALPALALIGKRMCPLAKTCQVSLGACSKFGASVGQLQQLMQNFDFPRGAALAKSLSGLTRQSN